MVNAREAELHVREAACDARDAAQDARDSIQSSKDAELARVKTKAEAWVAKEKATLARKYAVHDGTLAEREAAIERCEEAQMERENAQVYTAEQIRRHEMAEKAREELSHQQGALMDASQSRSILLVYSDFVQSGMDPNPAVMETARVMRLDKQGKQKVYQYVSFNYDTKRTMTQVWEQVRKGWYGDPTAKDKTGEGQDKTGAGNGQTAEKLFAHAIKEMNKWVRDDDVLGGTMGPLIVPDDYDCSAPEFKVVVESDGVELQEELHLSAEFVEFRNMGKGSEDGIELV